MATPSNIPAWKMPWTVLQLYSHVTVCSLTFGTFFSPKAQEMPWFPWIIRWFMWSPYCNCEVPTSFPSLMVYKPISISAEGNSQILPTPLSKFIFVSYMRQGLESSWTKSLCFESIKLPLQRGHFSTSAQDGFNTREVLDMADSVGIS